MKYDNLPILFVTQSRLKHASVEHENQEGSYLKYAFVKSFSLPWGE